SAPVAAPPTSTAAKRRSRARARASAPVAPVTMRVSWVGTSEVNAGRPACAACARAGSASATKAAAPKRPRSAGSGSGRAGRSRPSTWAVRCARASTCTPAMWVGGSSGSQNPCPAVSGAVPSAARSWAVASCEASSAARLSATALAPPVDPEVGTTSAVSSRPGGSCAGGAKGPSHSRARPASISPTAAEWACSESAEESTGGGTSQGSAPDGRDPDGRGSARVISALRVGERCPVGVALLEERVAALGGLVGHVRQACRLPGEDLLAHQPVVGEVEGELQHPDRLRGLRRDRRGHGERLVLEVGVVHDPVHGAPVVGVLGGVLLGEEEDLPRPLLPHLLGEVGGAVAAVEGAHVRIGLHEAG